MDGSSVVAGVSFGIVAMSIVVMATGLFRQSIMWTIDDKIRALEDEIRTVRRDLDGLGRRVSAGN